MPKLADINVNEDRTGSKSEVRKIIPDLRPELKNI